MYNVDSLEQGIEKCRDNIKVFEDAIDKERQTIKEYRDMIDTLEKKEIREKEARSHIEIVVES